MNNKDHYEFLRSLPYTRKPCREDDVFDHITLKHYSDAIQLMLSRLPVIDIKHFTTQDVNGDDIIDFFMDGFEQYHNVDGAGRFIYAPQFWLTENHGAWYIINNEGYNYARYVVRLRGFNKSNLETTLHCVPV